MVRHARHAPGSVVGWRILHLDGALRLRRRPYHFNLDFNTVIKAYHYGEQGLEEQALFPIITNARGSTGRTDSFPGSQCQPGSRIPYL
jgi:hypothetical protein